MKSFTQQFAAVAIVAAMLNPAYAQAQSVPVEEFGAFDPSTVLRSPAPESVEVHAFDMNRIVMQQTRMIRYQATAYQRKVAESRARTYMAAQRRKAPVVAKKSSEPSKSKTVTRKTPAATPKPKSVAKKSTQTPEPSKKGVAKKTTAKPAESKTVAKKAAPKPDEPKTVSKKAAPKPEPKAEEPKPEPKVAAPAKKQTRYVAVDTVKDERASPKAKKVVMIWDTHSETLVGNDIYEVQAPPPVGATTKFDTYVAEYIGAGN